jgi:hypothetical protein
VRSWVSQKQLNPTYGGIGWISKIVLNSINQDVEDCFPTLSARLARKYRLLIPIQILDDIVGGFRSIRSTQSRGGLWFMFREIIE